MRHVLLAMVTICFTAGCAITPAQKTAALKIGCAVDGVVQPLAAPLVASIGPAGTSVASADTVLVHPAVMAACAALGGTPAAVVAPAPGSPKATSVTPMAPSK